MGKQFTLKDWHQLTEAERAVMLDRLMEDLVTDDPPLIRIGQGDYAHDYDPDPPAIDYVSVVTWTAVGLAAIACVGLALWIGGQL